MRILIVHNHYQHPGGEDTVVSQEQSLLAETETVSLLTFQNRKGWRGLVQTALSPWNFLAARQLANAIRQFRPDVIHIHNLHYAIGPIAVRVAKRLGIPVVMTLHNYRLVCPSATLFHAGRPFTDSLTRSFPWRAVRLGVHSGSAVKTWWLAFTTWMHKALGTWKAVDRYIALTPFAKQLVAESTLGIPPSRISVKQNFLAPGPVASRQREGFFLFVGRLAAEKGVETLLQSFAESGAELAIAGDGPLRPLVEQHAQSSPHIRYAGALSRTEVGEMLSRCTALVFPSIWYEGMPMTLIEAFAAGTPVIASDLGAMQAMVSNGENGLLFNPGDARALRETVGRWTALAPDEKQAMGQAARREFEEKYDAVTNRQLLMDIYRLAIESAKGEER